MEEYLKIDIIKYVKEGIENGTLIPKKAKKIARVMAHQGKLGEEVISWSSDFKGKEIKEKVARVELDLNTNQLGWIVTKVNEDGEEIIDQNSHKNQWIIDDTTFNKKYDIDIENPNLFCPKGALQIFVQINDNIILNQWGQDMAISKGGYINITNVNDMYGISKRDFEDSYKFVEEKIIHKK